MTSTHRIFRFDRRAVRRRWYLGPWFHGAMAVFVVFVTWEKSGGRSLVAWGVCALLIAVLIYRWRQMRTAESALWKGLRAAELWFEHGTLHASNAGETSARPLADVVAIDAVVRRNDRIARLQVATKQGERWDCEGFDDMDAFAAELRRNAPQAKFRRMRYGFPMRLKEI